MTFNIRDQVLYELDKIIKEDDKKSPIPKDKVGLFYHTWYSIGGYKHRDPRPWFVLTRQLFFFLLLAFVLVAGIIRISR